MMNVYLNCAATTATGTPRLPPVCFLLREKESYLIAFLYTCLEVNCSYHLEYSYHSLKVKVVSA